MTSRDRAAGPDAARLRGAASTLLTPLVGRRLPLTEVARTRLAVHYDTGVAAVPVLCVALPAAVRLPGTLLVDRLPDQPPGGTTPGPPTTLAPTRWWQPPRPTGLVLRRPELLERLPRPPYPELDPRALVGRGAGLTPEGDDLVAAALVTARATGDPRLARWRRGTRVALATRRTTAVSRGLLHHALDGWATPELADLLDALAGDDPLHLDDAVGRLLGVGHTSGAALLDGVALTLTTRRAPVARPARLVPEGAA